jgi:ATP-dependent phosphofructokinase / diphosphate-dependent phosphofructokinase
MNEHVERDAHGNIQLAGSGVGDFFANLAKTKLGIKRVRSDTFGYLQRSFPGLAVSETDAREARLVGQMAVKYSTDPANAEGSVAMRRKPGGRYEIETFLTPLKSVAREAKHMDASYIENGNNITQAFIDYASPLVGKLPVVGGFDELK